MLCKSKTQKSFQLSMLMNCVYATILLKISLLDLQHVNWTVHFKRTIHCNYIHNIPPPLPDMLTLDGSKGVPLNGEPSASHACFRRSWVFYGNKMHTIKIWGIGWRKITRYLWYFRAGRYFADQAIDGGIWQITNTNRLLNFPELQIGSDLNPSYYKLKH